MRTMTPMKCLAVIGITAVVGLGLNSTTSGAAVAAKRGASTAQTGEGADPPRRGDLVRLRSGSPMMTVEAVQGEEAICEWVTEFGEVRSARFPVALLIRS